MLRLDGDGKGDAFAGEFTIDNLAYLHAVKNERLTSINTEMCIRDSTGIL